MVLNRRSLEKACLPRNKTNLGHIPYKNVFKKNSSESTSSSANNIGASTGMNVFVRVRPHNEKEYQDNLRTVTQIVDEKMLVFDPKEEDEPFFFRGVKQKGRDMTKKLPKEIKFLFDGVFGPEKSNLDVHLSTTNSIISRLLEGYNCSVFVYGATGAGKTHTMLGSRDNPGIMYHTMADLYNQINILSDEKDFHVGVTFVEVYNENVHNLLHPSGPMHLREDSNGVTVAGLKIEDIFNAEQLLEKLAKGNANRTQHPTDANAESSRSHAVFQVYMRMVTKENNQVKIAKLSMIDLAGSERGMATGCKGMRFKEGSNINKSLLALGNCISSLAEGLRHVPYRDSKLTRILKDSLGGNCYTIMIANVSPSSASYEDTYNTLKYATRAKKIKTKLTKNIMSTDMHVSHYLKLVEELKKENTLLKSQVRALELTVADSGRATSSQPDTSIWCNHLDILFEEKTQLRLQLLNIRSEAKLLEYRIKLMRDTKSKMEGFDDAPAARIARMESSLSQFEARLEVVQGRIKELGALLDANKTKLLQLYNEMEEARVLKYMEKEISLRTAALRNAEYEVLGKHYLRLITIQQKRDSANTVALTNLQNTLSNYYRVLSGMNRITIDMKTSYQTDIQALEGIKCVSWSDEGLDNLTPHDVRTAINLSIDDSLSNLNPESFKPILKPMVLPIMDEVEPNLVDMEEVEAAEETPLNVTADIAISILDTIERPKIQPLETNEVKENNDALSTNNETVNITEKDKNNVVKIANVPATKSKKNTFIFPRSKPLSKSDFSISKKNNKENIQTTNELFKTPVNKVFSNTTIRPITKTPAPNRLQQRSALKPKLVNVQSDPNTTVILSSSAPTKDYVDSFKVSYIKKRFKSHPYRRTTDKKT